MPAVAEGVPRGPALIVATAVAVAFALAFAHSVLDNEGHAVFALDDPYIHLAMAHNIATHGMWGVTPSAFSATSSAPLYTAVLALIFLVTGASPFWLWLFASGGGLAVAILLTHRITQSFEQRWVAVILGLWGAVVVGIPETMFTGMEHALHALAVLWVAGLLERYAPRQAPGRLTDVLLITAVLTACGLRYEGLFLLPFVFLYLLWQKRRSLAILTFGAGVLPAVVTAVLRMANGSLPLPNTLLIKGVSGYDRSLSFITRFFGQIDMPYLSVLLAVAALGMLWGLFARQNPRHDRRYASSGLFFSVVILHALLARVDRRYVPYLLALGVWACIPWVAEWRTNIAHTVGALSGVRRQLFAVVAAVVIASVAVFPFSERFIDLKRLAHVGQDIYAQQYQMARFFATEYAGETVALNDIGTTAWRGQNGILDLWGLSDAEVARERLRGEWTPGAMHEAATAAGAHVAAVYPGWFSQFGGLPREWTPVGAWQLPPGIQTNAAAPQVVFYGTSQAAAELLNRRLRAFASQLPAGATFTPFF